MQQLLEGLRDLQTRLRRPEAFLRDQAAPRLREAFAQRLQGGSLEPLAESTLAAKAQDPRYRGPRGSAPLAGGALEASFTQAGSRGHVEWVAGNVLEIGSELPGVHETGGSRAYSIRARQAEHLAYVRGTGDWAFPKEVTHPPLPARPVTELDESVLDELGEAFVEWVLG